MNENKMPLDIEAFSQLPCVLHKDHVNYRDPTPQEIKALRNHLGLSQTAFARLVGVPYKVDKGSNTVRKWEAPENSPNFKSIPYSAWRLLLGASRVVDLSNDLAIAQRKINP